MKNSALDQNDKFHCTGGTNISGTKASNGVVNPQPSYGPDVKYVSSNHMVHGLCLEFMWCMTFLDGSFLVTYFIDDSEEKRIFIK